MPRRIDAFPLIAPLLFASGLGSTSCATGGRAAASAPSTAGAPSPRVSISTDYRDLLQLFEDWRAFERPPTLDGAPDYSAAQTARRHAELKIYQARLRAIDPNGWPVPNQVDWHIVRAEMNGFDFNCRVLKPWSRDPAFYKSVWTYQSDTPAHEGPTHHALLELWTYEFPLSADGERRLIADLKVIPPLLRQARGNLTGNAKDLWIAGIRDLRQQSKDLDGLRKAIGPEPSTALAQAVADALAATTAFADWLAAEAPNKTGPSGVGRDHYTWYLQNVHLVPMTWEDEVRLLRRELERAWSSLRLEEHRNRNLPPAVAAADAEAYAQQADEKATRMMRYLAENRIVTVKPNMEPALRAHLGQFIPADRRNFFWITAHFDPTPLYTHFYHWWDLAQMRDEPHESPIRRGPLLYNIFDSRAEGTATGVEEMFMHAGLYDETPRSREIVWIMLAQRAARGLGSLYAHANEMTMAEASTVHVEWTPRGWMKTEPELLKFEQHLYLRQPGYGTSYVTGKYLLERLLADYTKQRQAQGDPFVLAEFFDALNSAGVIPMSLIRWQLTGYDDEILKMVGRWSPDVTAAP